MVKWYECMRRKPYVSVTYGILNLFLNTIHLSINYSGLLPRLRFPERFNSRISLDLIREERYLKNYYLFENFSSERDISFQTIFTCLNKYFWMDIKWNERVTTVSLNKLVLRGQVKLWNIAKTFKLKKKSTIFRAKPKLAQKERNISVDKFFEGENLVKKKKNLSCFFARISQIRIPPPSLTTILLRNPLRLSIMMRDGYWSLVFDKFTRSPPRSRTISGHVATLCQSVAASSAIFSANEVAARPTILVSISYKCIHSLSFPLFRLFSRLVDQALYKFSLKRGD